MKNRDSLEGFDFSLFERGERVLAALSGGADSVCLVHFLANNQKRLGIKVCAAHFMHGIRLSEAQKELELVKRLCESLDIELETGEGDVPSYARENGMGLEEAARKLRYDFLYSAARRKGAAKIATAHNLSDNSETVLFNLARGSGLSGLAGIPRRNGMVIRPMLAVSRGDIEEYDRAHGLEYATDMTNFDDTYSRNRIRLNVLPQLRMISPAADRGIAKASESAFLAEDYLKTSAKAVLEENQAGGGISLEGFKASHKALHVYILRELAERAGFGGVLEYSHVKAARQLALRGRVSSFCDIGMGFRIRVGYGALIIEKIPQKRHFEQIELSPGQTAVFGDYEITVGGNSGTAFEFALLAPPFYVRTRRQGDAIAMPYGSKSVKKYLIDKKIPAEYRDSLPVICDNSGILLLADLEKDRRRCYKNKGVRFYIECRRRNNDQ